MQTGADSTHVERNQFGTRTLLALVVLVAVGLGGWRYRRHWESTRPQRELAAAIRDFSGLTDEEKDVLCAIVWGKSGTDAENAEWIYGTWHVVARWEEDVMLEPRTDYNGDRRFDSDSVTYANGDECRYAYSRGGAHGVIETFTKNINENTGKEEVYIYVYNGDGDLMLMRWADNALHRFRRDTIIPPDSDKFKRMWIFRRGDDKSKG